jgi:hypothetical protein
MSVSSNDRVTDEVLETPDVFPELHSLFEIKFSMSEIIFGVAFFTLHIGGIFTG